MNNQIKSSILSLITLIIMSFGFSETITIYGTQSARYSSNSSASCCSPNSLFGYNQSSIYVSGCWWHDVYSQCFENRNTAIWRFDLSELPELVDFDASFQYDLNNQSWCENSGFITTTNETGPILVDLASNLWSNPDWEISLYNYVECENNTHIVNIPQSQIISGAASGQLNLLLSAESSYIDNSGLDAPRLVINYQPPACDQYLSSENCESNDENCDWIEDIETGWCSNLGLADCEDYGCNVECGWYHGSCGGCCYYECGGGTYEVDNGYCTDSNCENQTNAESCESLEGCDWVEDVQWGNCSNYNNSLACDNAHPDCSWDLCYGGSYGDWYHCCSGGSFQIDDSYCEELIAPDINLSFGQITSNIIEINYASTSNIGGFQFNLLDNPELITFIDVAGGAAEEAGFTVLYNDETGIFIGFSFEGDYIPRGEGLLTNVYFAYTQPGSSELCINETVFSDPSGNSLYSDGACTNLSEIQLGDLNGDFLINILDIIIIVDLIVEAQTDNMLIADFNQDGSVNILDIITMVNYILDNS